MILKPFTKGSDILRLATKASRWIKKASLNNNLISYDDSVYFYGFVIFLVWLIEDRCEPIYSSLFEFGARCYLYLEA